MSDSHREVPQTHISSAQSERHPSSMEQRLRSGLPNKPKGLEQTGTEAHPEADWKSRKGILDRDKNRQPSLGQALIHWDFTPVSKNYVLYDIPATGKLSFSALFDSMSLCALGKAP